MQEQPPITHDQREAIKKEYGLTEAELDTLIRIRTKRNAETLKKFIRRLTSK
ncbi:MAG: hypothetical protein AAGA86_01845 [Bacteroidota bacterium]